MTQTVHFVVEPHGTVVTFTPQTKNARRFASSELGLADWQWLSPETFAVDHRLAGDLWQAIEEAGWVVVPSTQS